MKKIVLVLLLVMVCFSGCNMIIDSIQGNAVCGKSLYDGDFPELNTIKQVSDYVMDNLEYERDGITAELAGPEKALLRGYGDCDEFALVFMNVAYYTLGLKFDFASVYAESYEQKSIGVGGMVNHAVVMLNGQLYSVYNGTKITDYSASYYYSFDDVFSY